MSARGFAAYLAWIALCVALHVILPGERKEGVVLRDGTRLTYKLNGAQPRASVALMPLCDCHAGLPRHTARLRCERRRATGFEARCAAL